MSKVDFSKLFRDFSSIKVGVVGDVMLDTYWWGNVDRISPEAPVPVVALTKKDFRLGGAANVALNVQAMSASVSIISIIGDDEGGIQLEKLFKEQGISTTFLLKSKNRITTSKTRVISRNQQMLRMDAEMTTDIDSADENQLLAALSKYIETEKPQIIIFEDYNKGLLTEKVIGEMISLCNSKNILTAVDPKRRNFFSFKKASIFKPNIKEVREAFNIIEGTLDEAVLRKIHQQLRQQLAHDVSLITLSERGIFYEDAEKAGILPAHIRSVADVSGAGDTVIAVASLVYATTHDTILAAEIANLAGGIVCEEVGTVAIDKEKLLNECLTLLA